MGSFDCVCLSCSSERQSKCSTTERVKAHCEEVATLLALSSEIVTIVTDYGTKRLSCHKILLGYFSSFMKAAFYGTFAEATGGVMTMSGDDADAVGAFISWCYSGQIFTTASLESCWILGDKIDSPKFTNEAMYDMFNKYGPDGTCILAADAALVWEKTMHTNNSLLRGFTLASLKWMPPLSDQAIFRLQPPPPPKKKKKSSNITPSSYQSDWEQLVIGGGQFVVEVMRTSNRTKPAVDPPHKPQNQIKYLLPVHAYQTQLLEAFINFHVDQTAAVEA